MNKSLFSFSKEHEVLCSSKSWMSRRSVQLWCIKKQKAVAHAAMKLMQSNVQDYSIPEQGKPGWSQWVSKNLWLTLVKSSSIWEASSANMLQSSECEQRENRDIPMHSRLALRAYIHSVLDAQGLGQVFFLGLDLL